MSSSKAPKPGNIKQLIDDFTYSVDPQYIEREVKGNVPDENYLDQVWDHIQKNGVHYHLIKKKDREPRTQYYWDTKSYDLFKNGIEARSRMKNSGPGCKQVSKTIIGDRPTTEKPVMIRIENSATTQAFEFDITASNLSKKPSKKGRHILQSIIGNQPLMNMVEITGKRSLIQYNPNGDPSITIEVARDIGRGTNTKGYEWDIYQLELEIKRNASGQADDAILITELKRLQHLFPSLETCITSKPTPGFRNLIAQSIYSRTQNTSPGMSLSQ